MTHAEARSVAVRCRNLIRHFGDSDTRTRALGGVDLDVFVGEITLLVGPSIVAGILLADQGQVEVFGTQVAELKGASSTRFRGANIGLVLQQFNPLPALTAAENVAVPLLLQGLRQRSAHARAVDLLNDFGLAHLSMRYPSELSMGQQQRVAIARALIHGPRLVICDEPTAMLDASAGLAVMQMLRRVALRSDRAVIIVTHDDRILPFADRIATMSDGRITDLKININRKVN